MRSANTSVVGHGRLLLSLVSFPSADTFVDVLGEGVVLAVAIVVGVVLALGHGNPCIDTAGED